MNVGKWQLTPFWKLTRWGCLGVGAMSPALQLGRGTDEFHNNTRYLIVPLVGMAVRWPRGARFDVEHLFAYGPEGWEGVDVPGCEICAELKSSLGGEGHGPEQS